jgi:NAD(P)-dependent dehydrogenase (short-subunit alcohol dehydrogenase family)
VRGTMPSAIVVGVSSGIGGAIARALWDREWSVVGTVRRTCETNASYLSGVIDHCDLGEVASVDTALQRISDLSGSWDALVVAPGTLEPIGRLGDVDPDAWAQSIDVNFVNQVRIVQGLLPSARKDGDLQPIVIFFAGGGSNSAPVGFSAYTAAKIALTKMTELLDAEYPDVRFCIIGPGWVNTKIHDQALSNPRTPIDIRLETERRISANDFVSMADVVDTVLWALGAPKDVVGGRNISVAHDPIHQEEFATGLAADRDLLKLRRSGNDYPWMERG